MKRLLLLSLSMVGFTMVNAQQASNKKPVELKPTLNVNLNAKVVDTKKEISQDVNIKGNSVVLVKTKKRGLGVGETIGATYYDLQTNNSMQPRIQAWGSNVGATWTMDRTSGDEAFPGRGTGYNLRTGTTWLAQPTTRVESMRTGFPSYVLAANNSKEYIVAHDPAVTNLVTSSRTTPPTWTEVNNQFPNNATQKAIWPHAAAAGNYVYIVDGGNDSTVIPNGIKRGHFLSISNNGGQTYSTDHIPFPGLNGNDMYWSSADNYAIDAKDSIVAVVFGSNSQYGATTLFKSTNYGQTFTKIYIPSFQANQTGSPVNSYSTTTAIDFVDNTTGLPPADNLADTFLTDDGIVDVLIDNNNKVHVFFAYKEAFNAGTGLRIFPSSNLAHYMETNSTTYVLDGIFRTYHDLNGDGAYGIGSATLASPVANQKNNNADYGTYGYIGQISSTVDANNNIYVFYSCIQDNDSTGVNGFSNTIVSPTGLDGQSFRDILVSVLPAGDTIFNLNTYPVNITKTNGIEEAFPSVPRRITGNTIPLIFHMDLEPGIFLEDDQVMTDNEVRFMELNTNDILADINDSSNLVQEIYLGMNGNANNNTVGSVFPNPSNSEFFVLLRNGQNENTQFTLMNTMGNVVRSFNAKAVDSKVKIDTDDLASGQYILQVKNSFGQETHKINIVR